MAENPVTTTYQGKEIRARGDQALFPKRPVTITSAESALLAGTILGRITASGLYKAYSDVAVDGSEVAQGILVAAVDPVTEGRDVPTAMYVGGIFVESELTGIDAAAKADLGGLFKFE